MERVTIATIDPTSWEEFYRRCTVRIESEGGGGTGVFVAPALIVTCSHVVSLEHDKGSTVSIFWEEKELCGTILAFLPNPYPDLALLEIADANNSFVRLNDRVEVGDQLWSFGYPIEYRMLNSGDPTTFEYEGATLQDGSRLLKLKQGQAGPGQSGSPVVNLSTGAVCGILKSTRNPSLELGGRAIPASEVLKAFPQVAALQPSIRVEELSVPAPRSSSTSHLESPPSPDRTSHLSTSLKGSSALVIPALGKSFTGRLQELKYISDIFGRKNRRVTETVVLFGLSGVGKTQICRRYIDVQKHVYSSVHWIDASTFAKAQRGMAQIAIGQNLNGAHSADIAVAADLAKDWLTTQKDWLLVLDDADPICVGVLLPSDGLGDILISSNSPHWSAYAEDVLPVSGLDSRDSISFLLKRTNSTDSAAAKEIAEIFEGLPLALEQAASYIESAHIDMREYTLLLERHRPELLSEKSSFTDYPLSVYSAIALNISKCQESTPGVERLLAFLSFVDGNNFPRELSKLALKEAYDRYDEHFDDFVYNRVIRSLASLSTISATSESISVHSLVQAFMRDQMTSIVQESWSGFALQFLASVYPDEVENSDRWPECDILIPHVVAAIALSNFRIDDDEWIEALYWNAGSYLHARGRDKEASVILESALEYAHCTYGPNHSRVALASNNLVSVLAELGRTDEAFRLGISASVILASIAEPEDKDFINLGKVLSNLGRVLLHGRRNLSGARELFFLAQRIHSQYLGDVHFTTAIDLNNLGTVDRIEAIWFSKCGLVDEANASWSAAFRHFSEAVAIHRKVLDRFDYRLAMALFNLGQSSNNLGWYRSAENFLREAVEINEKIGNGAKETDQLDALTGLGLTLMAVNSTTEAIRVLDKALILSRKTFGDNDPRTVSLFHYRGEARFMDSSSAFCIYSGSD